MESVRAAKSGAPMDVPLKRTSTLGFDGSLLRMITRPVSVPATSGVYATRNRAESPEAIDVDVIVATYLALVVVTDEMVSMPVPT
ncbi:MAG: hypothetical protein AAB393_08650, partial [Bacteroidota bacterium]